MQSCRRMRKLWQWQGSLSSYNNMVPWIPSLKAKLDPEPIWFGCKTPEERCVCLHSVIFSASQPVLETALQSSAWDTNIFTEPCQQKAKHSKGGPQWFNFIKNLVLRR